MTIHKKNATNPINEGTSMEDILSSIRRAMQEKSQEEANASPPVSPPNPTEDILDLQPAPEKEPLVEPSRTNTFKAEESREPNHFLDRDVEQQTKSLLAQLDQEVQRKQRQNFEESYFALERVLRPILKEWCNQHLPEIVARSVQKEIKQLVRTLTQRDYG